MSAPGSSSWLPHDNAGEDVDGLDFYPGDERNVRRRTFGPSDESNSLAPSEQGSHPGRRSRE